ncbi:MAG: hypothetical protein P8Y28_15410 [Gammaproteobacteria bacterium]|jgi:hypothetical protein
MHALFLRTELLNMVDELFPTQHFSKVSQWASKLLTISVLPNSVVGDFEEILKTHIKTKAPYAATELKH